jgi:hypothetical protein
MSAIGRRRWAIAEGYIPEGSTSESHELVSHEAICILNSGSRDAHVTVHAFFVDRPPAGPYRFTVPAERTLHVRMNDLRDPEPIPKATEYSSLIEADEPIVVQHTRLDSRKAELALLSTIAYASD